MIMICTQLPAAWYILLRKMLTLDQPQCIIWSKHAGLGLGSRIQRMQTLLYMLLIIQQLFLLLQPTAAYKHTPQTPKDLPQPQLLAAFGLWNWKPPPMSALLKSSCIPKRYSKDF